jgi:uncharacterized protein YciI
MAHFLYKLIPPRPSFPFDMTDAEKAAMQEHSAYWRGLTAAGTCLVYGPVLDPDGPWGLAVIEAPDDIQARRIFEADPVVASGLCTMRMAPILATFPEAGQVTA